SRTRGEVMPALPQQFPAVERWRGALFVSVMGLVLAVMIVTAVAGLADEKPLSKKEAEIDATTLRHKVLCGYQGWFRCPEDPAKEGWRHWSRDTKKIGPDSLTFEMWPDMTEYENEEKYPA